MPRWWNPPNLLTLTRIALTPVIGLHLARGDGRAAFPWILAASLTDAFDGWLARRFGWSTSLGMMLDPVADKVLAATAYVALSTGGFIPVWLTALVLGRDLMILLFAAWAMRRKAIREFPPSRWGKLSTLFQMSFAAAVVASLTWAGFPGGTVLSTLFWATAASTLWSGIDYGLSGWRMVRQMHD